MTFALLYLVVEQRDKQRQEQREGNELKARLIREMKGKDHANALKAIDELRAHRWLYDGSLQTTYLPEANLQGADLENANLRWTFLGNANLQETNLGGTKLFRTSMHGANLQGARGVTNKQLAKAYALRYATMPDNSKYSGHFNLEGDLKAMHWKDVDIDDPEAIAEFYEISLSEYNTGQEWARENAELLKEWQSEKE